MYGKIIKKPNDEIAVLTESEMIGCRSCPQFVSGHLHEILENPLHSFSRLLFRSFRILTIFVMFLGSF